MSRNAPRGKSRKSHDTIFPIRHEGRAIAVVSIDTTVAPVQEQLSACRDVLANIESLAVAQPGLFAGPFSHLDPQAIRF